MKYFAVVALIFSVLLVQTVVAQSWKDDLVHGWKAGIAEEYNHKYARFVAARTKTLNKLATLKNNVKTSECVKRATAHLELVKSAVKSDIDNCVNTASGKLRGLQCAQRAFKKLVSDALKATKC